MTETAIFENASPRLGLPYLMPGQAQKEFFVNQAHAIMDAIAHPAVQAVTSSVPLDPEAGNCWLVGADADGAFSNHAEEIAIYNGSDWIFVNPSQGMIVYDLSQQKLRNFNGTWSDLETVSSPTGGTTIDTEARAAIDGLIDALRSFGVFPTI